MVGRSPPARGTVHLALGVGKKLEAGSWLGVGGHELEQEVHEKEHSCFWAFLLTPKGVC